MAKRKARRRRRDPFANRINEVSAWDAEDVITPFSIKDCLQAAISWDLQPAFCGIIRSYWQNGKIEERAYRSPSAANKYMAKLLENECDFTLLTDNMIRDTIADYDDYED